MSTPVHSWICAGCGRRVPLRVEVCHCGATREQALQHVAAPATGPGVAAGGGRSLPTDVRALFLAAVLTVAAGIGWLVYSPPKPEPVPPLLGYLDAPPPPRPASVVRRPPLRMPWWR